MDCVTFEIEPRKMFVPALIITAIPIVSKKSNGSNHEPHIMTRIRIARPTAKSRIHNGISTSPGLSFLNVMLYCVNSFASAFSIASSSSEP